MLPSLLGNVAYEVLRCDWKKQQSISQQAACHLQEVNEIKPITGKVDSTPLVGSGEIFFTFFCSPLSGSPLRNGQISGTSPNCHQNREQLLFFFRIFSA